MVARGGKVIEDESASVAACPTFNLGSRASPTATTVTHSDDLSKHYNKEISEFSRHSHCFLVSLCFL
jgi:hypothetical protein